MDEPFGAVDPVTRQRLQNLLLDLQKEIKKTIVMVTHDIDEAAKLADRIAVLSKGGTSSSTPPRPRSWAGRPLRSWPSSWARTAASSAWPWSTSRRTTSSIRRSVGREPVNGRRGRAGARHRARTWAIVVERRRGRRDGSSPNPPTKARSVSTSGRSPPAFPLGTSLRVALAELLQHDAPAIPVFNGNRYLGVLTFERLHAAMRRSLPGDDP